MPTTGQAFLDFSVRKLRQLTGQIEACLNKLDESQIWLRPAGPANSVGNLCLHLNGNVRQFILHGIGGHADVRVRDLEFSTTGGLSRAELFASLQQTVEEACRVLESLPDELLLKIVRPQDGNLLALDAVYQVVQHFALHTGQIMYATKNFTEQDLGFYRPPQK
jgi:hypothetical protein